MRQLHAMRVRRSTFFLAVMVWPAMPAYVVAQSDQPAVFVANNGNLEGSVTSYTVNADGSLHFVMKFVTGSTPSTQMPHPGTNAQTISLRPDGRYVMTGHGTINSVTERLTLLEVHPDATLTLAQTYETPDSPLAVEWIDNEHVAVTKTSLSTGNRVLVYHIDPQSPSLQLVDSEATGSFTTSLAIHPSRRFLYAQDSTGDVVRTFRVNADGTLDLADTDGISPTYPLGLGVSPDGTMLFSGGGISGGGHRVSGFFINPADGTISQMPSSPFTSPGSSPKQVAVSSDSAIAFVAHGTDATVRSFLIDREAGQLVSTGFLFDVGVQGSLGEIAVMGDLLLVLDRDTITDGVRGLYSFTVHTDGTLTQNGPLVDSQGITPNELAVWTPPATGDADGDGDVDLADFDQFDACLAGDGGPLSCTEFFDFDHDHDVDWADFREFQLVYTGP